MNAWIMPGSQARAVSMILIRNVPLRPCFINTAKGGKRIFNIMIPIDIIFILKD